MTSIKHTPQMGSAYAVSLPVFEGPLDLLLQLIERQELEISEVSLVAVTDQYLKQIEQMEEVDPGALADFLVIASRLVYIKSRSLLPQPRPPGEDDEDDDAGDALVRQLLEYRQFKQVAAQLRQREESGLRVYLRVAPSPDLTRRLDLSSVNMDKLYAALHEVLKRIPAAPAIPRVKTYAITVAEQIENVRRLMAPSLAAGLPLRADRAVTFADLLSQSVTRLEVIVTFLAVLELIKQQEIEFFQDGTFGEILLVATPETSVDDAVEAAELRPTPTE